MPLSTFHPLVSRWFRETLGEPTAAQRQGWAAIREGRHTLIAAPTGSGKTLAAFLTSLDDLFTEGLRGAAAGRGARRLRLAAEGAERRHPQEPRRAAPRHPQAGRGGRPGGAAHHGRGAHRRHDAAGARGDAADAAAHPRDDAGVALSAADGGAQPRHAAHGAHGDRRRDPRGDRHAPRRASGADARAAAAGRGTRRSLRLGLSATQKPIEEVARFLVGTAATSTCRTEACDGSGRTEVPRPKLRRADARSSTKAIAATWISASRCRARRSTR